MWPFFFPPFVFFRTSPQGSLLEWVNFVMDCTITSPCRNHCLMPCTFQMHKTLSCNISVLGTCQPLIWIKRKSIFSSTSSCDVCEQAKQPRHPFPLSCNKSTVIFNWIHCIFGEVTQLLHTWVLTILYYCWWLFSEHLGILDVIQIWNLHLP